MSQSIRLYTTAGCHLCEMAESMVLYLLQNEDQFIDKFVLQPVEIASDDALFERFGVRIPVLEVNRAELSWPFELEDLFSWLNDKIDVKQER